jgi:multicomponent Na+:H+ antiporter subunit F
MLTSVYAVFIIFLLLNLVAGLVRVARGPSRADRMLAAQLLGTTGTAVLLVLAEVSGRGAIRDVALVFALLAAVNAVVLVHAGGREARAGDSATHEG